MKKFVAVLLLASIGSIMGLKCYTCSYSGSGFPDGSGACRDPFNPYAANVTTLDCDSLDISYDVCAKTSAVFSGVDIVARSCFSSAQCPSANGCQSGGGATVCCCNGDNCNGAGSVAVNIVATVTVVIAAVMFTL